MNLALIFGEVFIIITSLLIGSAAQSNQDTQTGSVCVLPNSPEPPARISPGGQYNPATLTIRIDNRQTLHWPHKERVLVSDLNLQENHLVVLTSDGKRIQSFRFKFSPDDNAKLCIYFDGYQGVQLGNATNALWCRAERKKCWP
jgi:hypothetical protein